MDEQEFVQLLDSLLQADTERVKNATATLNKKYYSTPAALPALIHILTSHERADLRQLAAVEARKQVIKHWKDVPADQRVQLRNQLLQFTLNAEQTLVRHSTARVISAAAQIDFEDGEWADLPSVLQQASTSQTPRHREVGTYILFTLMEAMGDLFAENMKNLFTLFGKTIKDPDSTEVRINTLLALSRLAMLLDSEEDPKALEAFQATVPDMVQVLKQVVEAGDEDHAMQAFETFQTLLGCDTALLAKHFQELVQFMMELASQQSVEDDFRSQALAFLMQCVRYRKLKVQGLRLGEFLTIKALKIVTELGELSSEEEEVTPARSALGLLDILAESLPPSQVVVPLLKSIGSYVSSPDPDYRRAGILALGMCVEGAPDFIATQLKEILPMVLHLLEDPSAKVRAAALNGVARLSDDLAEDMGKEHARLIPAMVKNFDMAVSAPQTEEHERNLDIIRGSCNAIDSLIEGIPKEDAAKYVPELVPRFSRLFNSGDFRTQISAITAVGSIASAAEEAFMPYFEGTMQALGPYVTLKDSQDDLDLRGATCDSMGKIASAVGAQPFQPYVEPLMRASEEALHLDHPRLRETSYILWSTMAKIYEEEFAPFLDGVVKGLYDCLAQDEKDLEVTLGEEAKDLLGTEVTIAGKKVKVAEATNDDDDAEFVDIDADDDDENWDDIGAVTAVAMEKEIAVEVVGDVISATKRNFLPHFQKMIKTVLELTEHEYEGVRKGAIGTLWRAYHCLWTLEEDNGMAKWKPGLPLQVQPTQDLANLANMIMTATLGIWEHEEDRGAVTDINRDLAATLRTTGPAVLVSPSGTVVEPISQHILAIITKKHPCQQDLGDEFDDTEGQMAEESSEYDWLLIDTAFDVMVCLSAALGTTFKELWKMYEKHILRYASSQEAVERETAVGSMAECIGNMAVEITPHTSKLMTVILKRLSDEDLGVKSNAAYAAGLLCEKSNDEREVLRNYNTILAKLEPLLDPSAAAGQEEKQARLLDNAAGCVSRMILKHPNNVPIAEVLPRLLEILPLRGDYEENKPIFEMIVKLYQVGNETIRGLTPQVMGVLQKVLGEPEEQLDDETRAKVQELAKYLQGQK